MRVLSWCVAAIGVVVGLSLTSCVEPSDEPVEGGSALEGRWQVLALQNLHGCPEIGSVAPVEPGALTLRREAGGWRLVPRTGGGTSWDEAAPGVWTRRVASQWDGCLWEAAATWHFDGVGETRFESRFEATLSVSGADCAAPVSTCTASYSISGSRLPSGGERP